jgi:four helix bundle protein
MKESIIAEKSYLFAVRIVKLHLDICKREKYIFSLSNQLVRASSSIGANVEEALGGHSRREFSAKMSIAYKEAREAYYWIRLLIECGIIEERLSTSLKMDISEIIRILAAIVKSTKI